MIKWVDQPTELPIAPLERFYRSLAAADVIALEARRAAHGLLVVLEAQVRVALAQQLATSNEERGGLLLGRVHAERAPNGERYPVLIFVRAAVPSMDDAATAVSLRMEAAVWSRAREQLGDGELVLGWYHSHPGLGAFFSARDRKTQQAFFHQAFSLGWVIDPTRGEEKWFRGPQSEELSPMCVFTRA
jgi:proteasome lid subunit RPN8/RPN11